MSCRDPTHSHLDPAFWERLLVTAAIPMGESGRDHEPKLIVRSSRAPGTSRLSAFTTHLLGCIWLLASPW